MHPEFAPIAFISAILVLIILPRHWRARNVAMLAMSLWLFIINIIYGVEAILLVSINFALPSASLCISIHLKHIASLCLARTTLLDKQCWQIFEALMCFGLPLLFMDFIVQGHHFDIIEEYGCRPIIYFSIPSLFIIWIPPLVVSIMALVFAALALRHFMLHRISFTAHLTTSHSALTTSHYLWLMLMAFLQMVWSLALMIFSLWFNIMAVPLWHWTMWNDVHSDFGHIDLYATAFTPLPIITSYYVLWWMPPISTLVFMIFFVFGRDAMEEYKKFFIWFCTHILRWSPDSEQSSQFGFANLAETTVADN
ncbi:fungal pheromone STE3G-protein-coupled receptor [Tricholoma matsutake]|nr:fungal pheromone STE3G-protein-coupled receptor [Tricholoma matsutake 945]